MMKSFCWIILVIILSIFIGLSSNDKTPSLSIESSENSKNSSLSDDKVFASFSSSSSSSTTSSSVEIPHAKMHPLSSILSPSEPMRQSIEYAMLDRRKRPSGKTIEDECEPFTVGDASARVFHSPGHSGMYAKNISCVKMIEADPGYIIKLDFRDYFHIEQNDECKFDFLEVRDGAHGFSKSLGKFCGKNVPDIITSSDRFLWLHFKSDENIEYQGFKAVYEFVPRPDSAALYDDMECGGTIDSSDEGFVNSSFISKEKIDRVLKHNLHLECMWMIKVREGFKILLYFRHFHLEKPNDCESNVVDVFGERTDILSRLKHFCGFRADSVLSQRNFVQIRYFATAAAINSSFSIVYTAYREKEIKDANCRDNEHDCEDQTCIRKDLMCNKRENCRYGTDEHPDKCHPKSMMHSEEIFIMLVVFLVMLSMIIIAFVFNCFRKVVRDHKMIRDQIRNSHESKIEELDRFSIKPIEMKDDLSLHHHHLTMLPSPSFETHKIPLHFDDSGMMMADTQMFTRINPIMEEPMTMSEIYLENDPRTRENSNFQESEYQQRQNSENFMMSDELCDNCQIRDSLFQPIFRNKVTQSPLPAGLRFSTFGYSDSSASSPPSLPPGLTNFGASLPRDASSCQHHPHHNNRSFRSSISQTSDGSDNSSNVMVNSIDRQQQKRFIIKKDESTSSVSSAGQQQQQVMSSDMRKSAPDVVIISGCS